MYSVARSPFERPQNSQSSMSLFDDVNRRDIVSRHGGFPPITKSASFTQGTYWPDFEDP